MPAAKITRNDVAEAIHMLNQQGILDPGVHRLRTFLGRGSVTTVARFKNELRQIELERISPKETKPLPDPIARLTKRLWDELLAAVEATEQELITATERRLAEKQQQLDCIQVERDQAITRATRLTDELSACEKRVEDRQEHMRRLENQLGALKGQLSASTVSVESLREHKQQLKRTLAEMSKQSAVREKSLYDQLSQERNRSFELQHNAERRHQAVEARLQALREKQVSERTDSERKINAARERIQLLEANLNNKLKTLRAERRELSDHHQKLDKRILELEKEGVRSETELRGKDEVIEILSIRIQELQKSNAETKNHYERSIRQLETQLGETKTPCAE